MSERTPNPAYSKPSPPRAIEDQRWRRHHTGRTAEGVDFYDFEPSPTSGCQRRRRKAILRRFAQRVRSGVSA
jgi:hypothetical protein